MKKWLIISLIIGLSIGVYLWIKSKQTEFQTPELLSIDSINCIAVNPEAIDFTAVVKMANHANLDVQLINTEIKISNKQYTVGKVSQTNIQDIKAQSVFSVPIKFSIDPINLSLAQGVSGLLSAALGEQKSIPVHFSGYTSIKWQGVVVKIPIETDQNLTW